MFNGTVVYMTNVAPLKTSLMFLLSFAKVRLCIKRHMFNVCLFAYIFVTSNRLLDVRTIAENKG